ncbi:MAG: methylisocitrate lyase, partial [Candidatus Paceibacteria bacterium]
MSKTTRMSQGAKFRAAITNNQPLQIVGTINAYSAMMAEKVGHQAIYLSGGGVANASYGLPDLGITSLNDVLADANRITAASELPLLVDIDTGWGGAFNIARA